MRAFAFFPVLLFVGATASWSTETALVGRVADYNPNDSGEHIGIHGVEVQVSDPATGQVLASTYTDPSGGYTLTGLVAGRTLDVAHRKVGYLNYPTTVQVTLVDGQENRLEGEVHLLIENPEPAYRIRLFESVSERVGDDPAALTAEWSSLAPFALADKEPKWLTAGLEERFGAETLRRLMSQEPDDIKHYVAASGGGAIPDGGVVLAPEP